ncbi:MAG TPA: catalase [Steroidobacteraceae bacterium]|nr:catalase [Steroidobacteraceae bacterium]
MATRKKQSAPRARAKPLASAQAGSPSAALSSAHSTISGPSFDDAPERTADLLLLKQRGTQALAASMPANENKRAEYGEATDVPPLGASREPGSPLITASTVTESTPSPKTGVGVPPDGSNPANGTLDRVRVDSAGQRLTTNQGVPIADNQHSLKAGLRGPALLEDFILREKITHFDHERIPERVVHARGSAAHGFFECYASMKDVTAASLFAEKGKRTPVFVRFSTVVGERGSADTARDARGFAVKFYTDEGNWDLVGNNIPVFFIQDAMKFPDLVHAAKPEPHCQMPQAATAHDTFWDFVSLMPESTHMLMWVMSDRGIPRSYRMMQGFGVHAFRFVNEVGASTFVKFHWTPLAGTHSLDWDEAVKIAGADPDFHRRDLWEAIEAGAFPEYELGVQLISEEQAEEFSFDILDPTKLVPEELVPVQPVGRLVLDRNPDNFFAETEQVAFCTAHVVPGIDFSNDPLLAGRIHSYVDTQITRLGGANFHEIPVNASLAQVHNNQRDGLHRQAIARGRVNYEPNSLGGGCPFQAGAKGFRSFPEPIVADKVRGKPERFAEHYQQAKLFYDSQTPAEQAHIQRAFRFELTRVQTPAVRERVVAMLANVDADLAAGLAKDLGMSETPAPLAKAGIARKPEVTESPALSLLARPGEQGIRTRRIAILVADGVDAGAARLIHTRLSEAGAVPRYVGVRLGRAADAGDNGELAVEVTMEAMPCVLFDALVIPDGRAATETLGNVGPALDYVKDQYRHCKPILALGSGADLVENAGVPARLPDGEDDPGLIIDRELDDPTDALERFVTALEGHRAFAREMDPPGV